MANKAIDWTKTYNPMFDKPICVLTNGSLMVRKVKEGIQYKEGQANTLASLQEIVCSLQSDLNNSLNTNVEAQLQCIQENFEAGVDQYCCVARKTCNSVRLTMNDADAAPTNENDETYLPFGDTGAAGPYCVWPCVTKDEFCINIIYECASTCSIPVDVHEVYCAFLETLKELDANDNPNDNAIDWSGQTGCVDARADLAQILEGLIQLLGTYRSVVESSKCLLRTIECDLVGYLNSCKRPISVEKRNCWLNFDFPDPKAKKCNCD